LWFKLGLFSFAIHLVVLSLLFFVYRGSVGDLALTVRAAQLNTAIDVVWVKSLPSERKRNNKETLRAPSTGAKTMADRQGKKKVTSTKSGPKTELKSEGEKKINKKKEVKKKKVGPSHAQDERGKKKKLAEEKKKIEEKKLEKKKAPEKKKIEEKGIVEEKKDPSSASGRTEEDKKPVEIKKPEPEPEIKKSDENEISQPVRPEALEGQADTLLDQSQIDEQDLNFEFSGSYRDLEALQQFQELQEEISRCWRPPVGIAQTVSCQIKVSFDWDGKAQQIETVKPSGILMFDVSSRNAVHAMEAPKFVRGKTFTITFTP